MRDHPRTAEIPVQSLQDFCLFLAACAEGLFQEPTEYGPLRLLQAIGRIAKLLEAVGTPDPFLSAQARNIDENIEVVMEDVDAFEEFVSSLVLKLSEHSTGGA
jgi:hypothetical protein